MKTNHTDKINSSKKNKVVEIPSEGALGLLALGAVGIKAWRKKREEEARKTINIPTNE